MFWVDIFVTIRFLGAKYESFSESVFMTVICFGYSKKRKLVWKNTCLCHYLDSGQTASITKHKTPTLLLAAALCQNMNFTLQVKSKVSPQDSFQHFQHCKQEKP